MKTDIRFEHWSDCSSYRQRAVIQRMHWSAREARVKLLMSKLELHIDIDINSTRRLSQPVSSSLELEGSLDPRHDRGSPISVLLRARRHAVACQWAQTSFAELGQCRKLTQIVTEDEEVTALYYRWIFLRTAMSGNCRWIGPAPRNGALQ